MEGPTPVSALIHAATMVTAGVFLMIRCSPIFEYSPSALTLALFVGSITSFFAATLGIVQHDLKKVIAYSTCSQLGYMVLACGLSGYSISLFHLFNHAFFKALLFLAAGTIIHNLSDEQDMRRMGGLIIPMKFSYTVIIIGSLALAGFPFLSGFYSKDIILELAYGTYTVNSNFSYWFGTISAFITSYYSFRLIYLVFLAKPNSFKYQVTTFHGLDFTNFIPLALLSFGSLFSGYLFKDIFIGLGSDTFDRSIFVLDHFSLALTTAEFLPLHIKQIPTFFSISGMILSVYLIHCSPLDLFKNKIRYPATYHFFLNKWYFDSIYSELLIKNLLFSGYHITFKSIDKGLLEKLGPKGIGEAFAVTSTVGRHLLRDYVYNHISVSIFSLVVLSTCIFCLFEVELVNDFFMSL
jgi:NADH-ubiquinone oxidoreductase chain 5